MLGTLYRYPHPIIEGQWLYVGQGPDRDYRHRLGRKGFGRRFKKYFPDIELPQPIKEEFEVESQLELNELETIWMFQYHTWRGYPGGMNLTFPGSIDYKIMGLVGGPIGGRRYIELYGQPGTVESRRKGSKAGGLIGGKIGGRKNVLSGQIAALGRSGIGSRIAGRIAAESGHCARIARLGGLAVSHETHVKAGRTNKESGQMAALGRKYGKIQGLKNVESGHLAKIGAAAGRIGGRKNAESGQIHKARCSRWNIRRNKPCVCGQHDV